MFHRPILSIQKYQTKHWQRCKFLKFYLFRNDYVIQSYTIKIYGMGYVNKKFNPFDILTQVGKWKDLKCGYSALLSLKTNSPFNFALKDMYNMSYIQNLFFSKNVHWWTWTSDLELCHNEYDIYQELLVHIISVRHITILSC